MADKILCVIYPGGEERTFDPSIEETRFPVCDKETLPSFSHDVVLNLPCIIGYSFKECYKEWEDSYETPYGVDEEE